MAGTAQTRATLTTNFQTGDVPTQQNFEDLFATFLSMKEADINALTEKTTPHNDDLIVIEDSEDSNLKKKVKYSTLTTSPGGGESNTLALHPSATGTSIVEAKDSTELRVKGIKSSDSTITVSTSGNDLNLVVNIDSGDVSLDNVTNHAQLKRDAGDIATFTEKTTPVSADLLLGEDSAASNAKKKIQIGNLPFAKEFSTIASKTVAYSVAAGDHNNIHECSGTFTVTLPDTSQTTVLLIQNVGTGVITLNATGTLSHSGTKLKSQYDGVIVWHKGSGNWGALGKLGV